MKFDEIRHAIEKSKRLSSLCNWIASGPSWWPQTEESFYWLPPVNSPKEAFYSLFLSSFLNYWETLELYQRIGNLAYQARYRDDWKKVQYILEVQQSLADPYEIWFDIFTKREFYGNFLDNVERYLRKVNKRSIKFYSSGRTPRRKVRRRGYQDKGLLRPSHQRGRNLGDPNPGQDRRNFISHPLLIEPWEGEWRGFHVPPLSKGGEEQLYEQYLKHFERLEDPGGQSSDF